MDTVIITGAAGEPALSIARRLCGLGMRVYALAGTVPDIGLGAADEFFPVACDPTSPAAVSAEIEKILAREPHITGIVLAGQYLTEEFFEAVSTEEIIAALNAQVAAPLCAVRLALPSLIAGRGYVVAVSPGAGTPSHRALNAAADGALDAFTKVLFDELRDTGVKTCRILLQNNEGRPDPAARFTNAPQSRIHADIVADAVETVFRLRENNALTQIVLRPQATRETPHIPVSAEPKIRSLQAVRLPTTENFPPEEEPIPTPSYRRPSYAPPRNKSAENHARDDDDDFSDDYVDPELRYLLKIRPPNLPAETKEPKNNAAEHAPRDENRNETDRTDGAEDSDGNNESREDENRDENSAGNRGNERNGKRNRDRKHRHGRKENRNDGNGRHRDGNDNQKSERRDGNNGQPSDRSQQKSGRPQKKKKHNRKNADSNAQQAAENRTADRGDNADRENGEQSGNDEQRGNDGNDVAQSGLTEPSAAANAATETNSPQNAPAAQNDPVQPPRSELTERNGSAERRDSAECAPFPQNFEAKPEHAEAQKFDAPAAGGNAAQAAPQAPENPSENAQNGA